MTKFIGFLRMKFERRSRWDKKFEPINNLLIFCENIFWRARGYRVILCFGDSHVKVLRRLNFQKNNSNCRCRTVSVMGATIYGSDNLNSQTKARTIFNQAISKKSPDHDIAFMLGEIDTNFTIWAISKKKGIPISEVLEICIDKYEKMLLEFKKNCKNLYVFSCPLPTVEDGAVSGEYLSARSSVNATKKERTALAIKFNQKLKEVCLRNSLTFIDLDQLSLDPLTGQVNEKLLHKNPLNHHYDEDEFIKIIHAKLIELGIAK